MRRRLPGILECHLAIGSRLSIAIREGFIRSESTTIGGWIAAVAVDSRTRYS